ncbi:MAG: HEAT repeat domain-containing protein [Chloroflexi bacterium]|uniref:HEAT repeat domain-containing protein n=1 Tax=Candidatus Chlorohelix allophototropha TaxID=3003348 RepID=A0A8T7LX85_9CHLR|nr:HEAT repeat domain-containing protein [Chloroflexota bacterium]
MAVIQPHIYHGNFMQEINLYLQILNNLTDQKRFLAESLLARLALHLTQNSQNEKTRKQLWIEYTYLPDAIEKNNFSFLDYLTDSNPTLTFERSIEQVGEVFGWALESGFLDSTERLLFFSNPRLQYYFCALGCYQLQIDPTKLRIDGESAKVLEYWQYIDPTLQEKVINTLKQTKDKHFYIAVNILGALLSHKIDKNIMSLITDRTMLGEIRSELIKSFFWINPDTTWIEELFIILSDVSEHKWTRQSAAIAIGKSKSQSSDRLINLYYGSQDPFTRQLAIIGLGQILLPGTVEVFCSALNDSDQKVREKAASFLYQLNSGNKKAWYWDKLLKFIDDSNKYVRIGIVAALTTIFPEESVDLLGSRLINEPGGFINSCIVTHLRVQKAIPYLIKALDDPEKEPVAVEAAYSLQLIGDKQAIPTLYRKLKDKNEDHILRSACASALIVYKDEQLPSVLLAIARKEGYSQWWFELLEAIEEYQLPQFPRELIVEMRSLGYYELEKACEVWGSLQLPESEEYFILLLNEGSEAEKNAALVGLGATRRKEYFEMLKNKYQSGNTSTRIAAVKALKLLGGDEAKNLLEWIKLNDIGEKVRGDQIRYYATAALEELNAEGRT